MSTITTNNRTYEIVDKFPEGFFIWNIGNNMGSDEYIPLAEKASNDPDDYSINPDTVKAIKMDPEEVAILRKAAHYGCGNLKETKAIIKRTSKIPPKTYRTQTKRNLALKALPILEKYS